MKRAAKKLLFVRSFVLADNEGGPSRKKIFVKVTYRRARAWFELKDYHRALNDMACCVQEEPNDEILKKFYNEVRSRCSCNYGACVITESSTIK